MRIIVGIARIFVGILFIISGLIKLNDPIGFSFKLQEYFSAAVLNLTFLEPYALLVAIFVVIFEVLLGVMIIIGYAKKFTLWSLLLMIVFFTFLTFYSAYFNKVTDCGCFGDAIKLTPWESFSKDVVLLILILILFFGAKYIQPFFTSFARSIIIFLTFIGCLGITYYVLEHLPIIDFRAYAIGKNIEEGMSTPEDAPKPVYEYIWKYDVNGETKTVTNQGADPGIDGELLGVETNQVQAGYIPPIHDFTIERDDEDFTAEFLQIENLIVVISYNLDISDKAGFAAIREITNEAIKNGYKVIGMSSSSQQVADKLAEDLNLSFKFYFCDETTLKTIVRSNPGILELQKGTITQKLHFNDALDLKLSPQKNAALNLNFEVKKRLDSIAISDQKYRMMMEPKTEEEKAQLLKEKGLTEEEYHAELWKLQSVIDSANMVYVERYFLEHGYPGKSVVGEPTNTAAWYVLQHSDKIATYFPLIKKAGEDGELPYNLVAMMEDRYLMEQKKPQIYGTQGRQEGSGKPFIWPIENPETVNQRRKEAGFNEDIEVYAKNLFGEDFEYKVVTMEEIKA